MAAMEEKLLRGPLPLWKLLQKYMGPGMGVGYRKCPLFMVRGEADGFLTPAHPGWPQGQGLV